MADDDLRRQALASVWDQLRYHPGDAPWSCVECYHGRPCVKRVILKAAEAELNRAVAPKIRG